MPNWGEVLRSLNESPFDQIRKKYLSCVSQYTDRNVITYYSSFLQKPDIMTSISDSDKNAFMQAVHGLDKDKGLDLILHTPGGDLAAAESIVDYLKRIFGNNIRAIIPQIAMSAGTMIALSCNKIIMGKQSNLGPIDPQFGGVSCIGVLDEFEKAKQEVASNPNSIPLWQVIISKYHPSFLGDCDKAVKWGKEMVNKWLIENMLKEVRDNQIVAANIVDKLSSHDETKAHARHIHIDELKNLKIDVIELESLGKNSVDGCCDFQDAVLTLHHTYMVTFGMTNAIKIVENDKGNSVVTVYSGGQK